MKERVVYFDYLRVLALFSVVVLHIAAQNWYAAPLFSAAWHTFNIYDSCVRFGVPVFVMISGALFLDRDISIKKLYSKNISRLATAFIFWSAVYALVYSTETKDFLYNFFSGYYHLWFIPMLMALYVCIPLFLKLAENETILKYFLAVSSVFTFLIPQIIRIVNDFGGENFKYVFGGFVTTYENAKLSVFFGYAFYFMLGYYINKTDFAKTKRLLIYLLGLLGTAFITVMTILVSKSANEPILAYYDNFTVGVLLQSLAVFVFVKYDLPKPLKLSSLVFEISKCSFGAYLVHCLIIDRLDKWLSVNTLSFNPLVSVPLLSLLVFAVSLIISAIIGKIPFLKKFIV